MSVEDGKRARVKITQAIVKRDHDGAGREADAVTGHCTRKLRHRQWREMVIAQIFDVSVKSLRRYRPPFELGRREFGDAMIEKNWDGGAHHSETRFLRETWFLSSLIKFARVPAAAKISDGTV